MTSLIQQARRLAWSPDRKSRPEIRRISRSQPLEDFVEALEKDGCVIVTDFTDLGTLDQAGREVQPWLDKQDEGKAAKVGALGGKTRTVTRLIRRSPTVREKFYADPLYQSLCDYFIGLETTHWYGDKALTTKSDPLLSIAITFDIPPGTPAQQLHRDDKNHHARHSRAETYEKGRDMLLGLFVPQCDTTKANGGTRVVPGSHLWDDERPDFGPDGTQGVVDAEMKRGEAFIMLGSLYHGGGAYLEPLHASSVTNGEVNGIENISNGISAMMNGHGNSNKRESRTVHAMFSCSGVHRQEEISFLSYPIEEVKTYSKLVQERLGWKQSEPNLGWVDLKSPEFMLENNEGMTNGHL